MGYLRVSLAGSIDEFDKALASNDNSRLNDL